MTTAGMLADVVAVEDDHVVLEIAPGVEVRYVKQAIAQVVPDDDDEEIEDETEEDAEETGESERAEEGTEEPEDDKATEVRETLPDEVEAKTETLPGATGNKTGDASLNDGEDKSGKRPKA
jgi:preprotein translocase subunit YajC